ncbi:hypothetical protein QYE76_037921 [Lolium multiflorum]|uniref:AP2/ERF domain-containing protein n=1 Tax=Lolium multiflorum TaxID=4521 RepID=A0AAD8WT55_LOLMU|nr:hypothetical protein QYE76_037921 [Lolium multiflorum]
MASVQAKKLCVVLLPDLPCRRGGSCSWGHPLLLLKPDVAQVVLWSCDCPISATFDAAPSLESSSAGDNSRGPSLAPAYFGRRAALFQDSTSTWRLFQGSPLTDIADLAPSSSFPGGAEGGRWWSQSFGFRGVRARPNDRFYAEIRAGGSRLTLGTYDAPELASRAYDAAAWRFRRP